jgi:hypothetical protein
VRPMAKPMGTPINIRPKKTDRIKPAMEFSYLSVPMGASITPPEVHPARIPS